MSHCKLNILITIASYPIFSYMMSCWWVTVTAMEENQQFVDPMRGDAQRAAADEELIGVLSLNRNVLMLCVSECMKSELSTITHAI